jgi:hypothetical protein
MEVPYYTMYEDEDLYYDEIEFIDNTLYQFWEDDVEADKPIVKDAYKEISRDGIKPKMESEDDDDGFRDPADMYGHQKELARLRQKKFYDAHKAKLLQKKRAERRELKRLRIEVVELQQAPAPAPAPRRRGNKAVGPVPFTDAEIQAKIKEAKKVKFTPEIVTQRLTALLGTVNQTTHEEMKKSTLDNHIRHIATVFRATGCPDLGGCLKKFDEIKRAIDETYQIQAGKTDQHYSLNSKKNFIQTILFVISNLYIPLKKDLIKKYDDLYERFKIESAEQQKEREQSEEHAVLPYNVYLQKIKAEFPADSKQVLVASMYNEVMARDNYGNLKILVHDKTDDELKEGTDNYLVVGRTGTKVKVILTNYKTEKRYGIIRDTFSTEVSTLIRNYMERNGIKSGDYLFGNGKKLSTFVGTMNRKIGIEKGQQAINYIRHSKKTEIFMNPNLTAEEKLKASKAFAHSPVTSLAYIRKVKLV